MSAQTDDAIQSIQNIIAKGMTHKDEMYAVQGYCDMLTKEIADLEDEVDNRREDMNTIIPQQDEEIERLNNELDAEHHRANVEEERAKAWEATAERMAEWMATCSRCPFRNNKNQCYGNCDIQILAHFGAPEEDADASGD